MSGDCRPPPAHAPSEYEIPELPDGAKFYYAKHPYVTQHNVPIPIAIANQTDKVAGLVLLHDLLGTLRLTSMRLRVKKAPASFAKSRLHYCPLLPVKE